MIILRQNNYSTKSSQLIFNLKNVANKATTGLNNLGLKAGRALKINKVPEVAGGFKQKSKIQLMRESIAADRGVRNVAQKVVVDPYNTIGGAINNGILQPAASAPLGTISMNALPIPGTFEAFLAAGGPQKEAQMWNKLGVGKVTKPVRMAYQNAVTTPRVAGVLHGAVNGVKAATGIY